jgi:hypothetical protein
MQANIILHNAKNCDLGRSGQGSQELARSDEQ